MSLKKTNYAFVIDGFTRGGAQQVILELIREFRKFSNCEFSIVLLQNHDHEIEVPEDMKWLQVFRIDAKNILDFKAFIRFFKLILDQRFNSIICNLYWSQIWGAITASILNVGVLWVEHNTYKNRTKLQWKVFEFLSKRTNSIVSVSNDVKTFLLDYRINSHVILNPVRSIENYLSTRNEYPTFIFIGRLVPQKRPLLVVESLSLALKESLLPKSTILEIFGEGPLLKVLQLRVTELAIEKNVIFRGFVPNHQLRRELSRAHTLISTSEFEGFALSRIEAVATGLCVISTATGGFRETFFNDNLNQFPRGIFQVDPDPAEIGNIMANSINEQYWTRECIQVRQSIIEKFSPEFSSKEYLTLLTNNLNPKT